MIWLIALGAAVSAPAAPATAVPAATTVPSIAEAAHALDVGRPEQARLLIADAIGKGASGQATDRLLARLALAEGHNEVALAAFQQLLKQQPDDAQLLTGAGIAAARLHDDAAATAMATAAAKLPGADWRTFDLLGVLADRRSDWAAADAAYKQALRRSPAEPATLNNAGWSQLARGRWAAAEALFRQAVAAQPASHLFANNLELARAALAAELPQRKARESDADYAARLNDAGVAAGLAGDKARAISAFARAVEVNRRWDQRAYNNLQAAQAAK